MNYKHRKRCPTLSGRLVLLFIAMALLIIITVVSTLGWAFRGHFEESIRPHLIQYMAYVQQDLGLPPNKQKALQLAERLQVDIHYIDSNEQWSTNGTPLGKTTPHYIHPLEQGDVKYGFGHHSEIEYLIVQHPDYTLALSAKKHPKVWFKIIPIILILAILALLYHATRRLFAPIEQLKYGIEQIGEGNLEHRINIYRKDELGELGNSINAMADQIQHMLEAKRQLLLAISHELRSPLTRAKVSAELIDDAKRKNEIHRDLNEMENLIEELLETERLSGNHKVLNKTNTSLQTLIKSLLAEHFNGKSIVINLPDKEIRAEIDVARIKLLLKNLIDNALRYNNNSAQSPLINLALQDQKIILSVRDFGQGIDESQIANLTEPFYRVDPARQHQTGGYGLGLYLCKVIAEAHGGELQIHSQIGKGTEVCVTLPWV